MVENNNLSDKLMEVVVVSETLFQKLGELAKMIESCENTEKSVGFKPRLYESDRDSSRMSKPKVQYGHKMNVEKDYQKSDNSSELISKILSGEVRQGEVAKRLKDIS